MSPAALAWLRFRRHRAGLAGAVFLLLLAAAAWSAPLIEAALGIDAESVDLFARYAPPSAAHPLGADDLGRDLLARLQEIEAARGRTRPYDGAPRTLDLDLILAGDLVVAAPGLTVPHPRFRERRFVLEPLAAVAPDLTDPVTGLTVQALLDGLDS